MFNLKLVRKLGLRKQYDKLVLLPVGTVLILVLLVLIFGLGLDKKLTSSSVAGYIVDDFANPVVNALVCVDDKCISTSAIGYYKLDKLTSGDKEISISSLNHNNIQERIRLSRGANSLNLSLTPAELTNATIQLVSSEEVLHIDDVLVTLSDKAYSPISIDPQKAEIILTDIKTGVYFLKIVSDYYIDQEVELVFEGGMENDFPVILHPAAEFHLNVVDWLNDSPLQNVDISVDDKTKPKTDVQGRLFLTEVPVNSKEIRLVKENYLPLALPIQNITPGENEDVTARLIPARKIAYTKTTVSGKQVFLSNYDGSGTRQLTTSGVNKEPWIDEENERVYYRTELEENRDSINYTDFFGEESELLSSKGVFEKRVVDLVDYHIDIRFFVEESEEGEFSLSTSRLDDSPLAQVLSAEKRNIKNLQYSRDGEHVVYQLDDDTERGIYYTSLRQNHTQKLLDQISQDVTPHAFSYDKKLLAVTIENDIFIYNFADDSLERLTSGNQEKSSIKFIPEQDEVSYLVTQELFIIDIDSQETLQLNTQDLPISEYRWEDTGVFSFLSNDDLYISSVKNSNSPQLVAKSVGY